MRALATVGGRLARLDQVSTGSNVPLLGRGSTGHSILWERVLGGADAVPYRARQPFGPGTGLHKMRALPFEQDVCLPCCLPALPSSEEQ